MSISFKIRARNLENILKKLGDNQLEISARDNPAGKAALIKSANLIINQAKLNIRSWGLIDTGRLLNSLRYEFYRPENKDSLGVRIGSFGVPYAAVWEFGFHGTVAVRGHTRMGNNVRAHSRKMSVPKKPYLLPAYEANKLRVRQLITEASNGV